MCVLRASLKTLMMAKHRINWIDHSEQCRDQRVHPRAPGMRPKEPAGQVGGLPETLAVCVFLSLLPGPLYSGSSRGLPRYGGPGVGFPVYGFGK